MPTSAPQLDDQGSFAVRPLADRHADARGRVLRLAGLAIGGCLLAFVAGLLEATPLAFGAGSGLVVVGAVEVFWRWRRRRAEGDGGVRIGPEALVVETGTETIRVPFERLLATYRQPIPGARGLIVEYRPEGWLPRTQHRIPTSLLEGQARGIEDLHRALLDRLERAGHIETVARSAEREDCLTTLSRGWPAGTLATCLALGAAFLLAPSAGPFIGDELHETMRRLDAGALAPVLVADGQWFRVVTYQLVHADVAHLGRNLAMIAAFGAIVEQLAGRRRYLLVVLAAGLGAGILAAVTKPSFQTVAGSSTISFGLAGALIGLMSRMHRRCPPALLFGAGFLGLQAAGFATVGTVIEGIGIELGPRDHQTHLYAVVLGAAVGALTAPTGYGLTGRDQPSRPLRATTAGLLVVTAAAVAHLSWHRHNGPHLEDHRRFVEAASTAVERRASSEQERAMMEGLLVDLYGWSVAGVEGASAGEVDRVRKRLRAVVDRHPDTPRFRHTLARLEARRALAVDGPAEEQWRRAVALQRRALFDAAAEPRRPDELQLYASQLAQLVERCGQPCAPTREAVRGAEALAVLVAGRVHDGSPGVAWSCRERPDDPTVVFSPDELPGLEMLRDRRLVDAQPREDCGGVAPEWGVWYLDTRLPALEGD